MRQIFSMASAVLGCSLVIGTGFMATAGAAERTKGAFLAECTGTYPGVTVKPNAAAPGTNVTVTIAPGVYSNSLYGGASAVAFTTLFKGKCLRISPVARSSGPTIPFSPPWGNVPIRADFCTYPEPGPWYVVVIGNGPIGAAQFTPICALPTAPPLRGGFPNPK